MRQDVDKLTERIPLKQGLKPDTLTVVYDGDEAHRANSTKTRIETYHGALQGCAGHLSQSEFH